MKIRASTTVQAGQRIALNLHYPVCLLNTLKVVFGDKRIQLTARYFLTMMTVPEILKFILAV
jgi:hypothetical protein